MKIFKIIVILGIAVWFIAGVRFTRAGQIVSTEKVVIDSTVKEFKRVSPDEIQRLENDRDLEIAKMQGQIAELQIRVAKLESQINR
jgi:TolA-binding protein